MAKTMVVKLPGRDKTPLLRGILVQSLVSAGIAFDAAMGVAQRLKDDLRDTDEISTRELRSRVGQILAEQFSRSEAEAYAAKSTTESGILVRTPFRNTPFSVGMLAHSLESCAIEPEVAFDGARKVQETLVNSGHRHIDHRVLRRITYRCLRDHCSQKAAERYLSWRRFRRSGKALIILIGGVPGTGKSTIGAELAYRLDVVRTQSTDLMRAIIRAYLPPHVIPTLSYSSFEAWRGLATPRTPQGQDPENLVLAGFLSQVAAMQPALEATIARVVEERDDLILEGVHVLPTSLDLPALEDRAVVVGMTIATMRKKYLRRKLENRSQEAPERSGPRYVENIDDIWDIQSYLLDEADRANIPIIVNRRVEYSVREILELLSDKVAERFPPSQDGMDWE